MRPSGLFGRTLTHRQIKRRIILLAEYENVQASKYVWSFKVCGTTIGSYRKWKARRAAR